MADRKQAAASQPKQPPKRGRPAADPNAPKKSKAERFIELGSKRTGKALKAIRQIGNLSNKGSYEYTEEQVQKIISALRAEVDAIESRFTKGKTAAEEFKL